MASEDSPDTRPLLVARLDDWLHQRRAKRAIKRGKVPSVIPYIGYGTTDSLRVLGRLLFLKPESREHTRLRPDVAGVSRVRGWRTFTSVHVPFQRVQVCVDGEPIAEVQSDRGGVINSRVPASLDPGWHTVTLRVIARSCAGTGEAPELIGESADAPVYIVDPDARFGVLSDIDDTILMTALPRPFVAAWNTFVVDEHARTPTPGMAVLLDHLIAEHPGSPAVYLSTGAWNAAPALSRFLARNLYPMGPLLLTDWGPTPDRWFRSGQEHKREELLRLAEDFPEVKWVLLGDDGQHDEAIYHEFTLSHPQNVAAVAIRQLSVGEAVLAGGRSKAQLHRNVSGVPWVYGPDGATLREELVKVGVL